MSIKTVKVFKCDECKKTLVETVDEFEINKHTNLPDGWCKLIGRVAWNLDYNLMYCGPYCFFRECLSVPANAQLVSKILRGDD